MNKPVSLGLPILETSKIVMSYTYLCETRIWKINKENNSKELEARKVYHRS